MHILIVVEKVSVKHQSNQCGGNSACYMRKTSLSILNSRRVAIKSQLCKVDKKNNCKFIIENQYMN